MIREQAMPFDFGDERETTASEDRAPGERSTEAAPSTAEPAQSTADGGTSTADDGTSSSGDGATSAALRDAAAIAARVAADEQAADAERERLAHELLPVLDGQAEVVFQLASNERLHVERRAAMVERGQDAQPSGGILYLTSSRLVHIGNEAVEEVRLADIADMAVALERLLLVELADGSDLAIEIDQPRLLRVQVSAARAALREKTS